MQLSLSILRGLIPDTPPPLWIPKSQDAQVSYIKWHKTMHSQLSSFADYADKKYSLQSTIG